MDLTSTVPFKLFTTLLSTPHNPQRSLFSSDAFEFKVTVIRLGVRCIWESLSGCCSPHKSPKHQVTSTSVATNVVRSFNSLHNDYMIKVIMENTKNVVAELLNTKIFLEISGHSAPIVGLEFICPQIMTSNFFHSLGQNMAFLFKVLNHPTSQI